MYGIWDKQLNNFVSHDLNSKAILAFKEYDDAKDHALKEFCYGENDWDLLVKDEWCEIRKLT